MSKPKILAFAGSARKESFNRKLVEFAGRQAEKAGAEVTVVNLGDFAMPIFCEDLEKEGTPEGAIRFKKLMIENDGLLISCPEYNSSITPLLKNAIDWASRPAEGESPLVAFRGKVAGLMAASPGGLGGLRGLVHVRAILGNIGVIVLPDQMAISQAHQAFDDSGQLIDERQSSSIERISQSVVSVAQKLGGG